MAAFPDKLRAIQQGDKPTDNTTAMGRPALQVRVRIQDTDIDLIAAHFKSKLLTFPPNRFSPQDEGERARFGAYALYRRAAEAVTVRATATALLNNDDNDNQTSVMVLDDLNDEVEAATTQIRNGPTGSEIGTGGFNQPDHGDRQRQWNLAPRIPEAQRFSRIYRGREELIDHIFASHALVGKIAQDHVTTGAAGPTPWIDDDPTKRRGAPGSTYSRGRDTRCAAWRAITTARSAGATSVGAAVSYSVAANSFARRRRCFSDHRGIHRWRVGVGAAI